MSSDHVPLIYSDNDVCIYSDNLANPRGMAFIFHFPKIRQKLLCDFGKGFGRITGQNDPEAVQRFASFIDGLDSHPGRLNVFLTHSHLDHMYGLPQLSALLPIRIHGSVYTHHMVRHLCGDRPCGDFEPNVLREQQGSFRLGELTIHYFPVVHSAPQTRGLVIEFPRSSTMGAKGKILLMAEFRIAEASCTPGLSRAMLQAVAAHGPYDVILYDGLRQGQTGFTPPEDVIRQPLRRVLEKVPGDLLVPFISSKTNLINALFEEAIRAGACLDARGGSMIRTFERCYEAGWISMPQRPRSDQQMIFAVTGSQSEPNSFLDRLSEGHNRYLMSDDFIFVVQGAIPMYREAIAQMYQELTQRLPSGGILLPRAELRRLKLQGPKIYSIEKFIGMPDGEDLENSSGHGKRGDHELFLEYAQRRGACPTILPYQVDTKNVDVVDDMGEVTEAPTTFSTSRMPLTSLVDQYMRTMRSSA